MRETGRGEEVNMGKTFAPQKYNMVFCPVCNGKGKLPKNPHGFDVCTECGGFGAIKKKEETFGIMGNENLREKRELA